MFHDARNRVTFFPGALEVLETLADSYTLGALSNGNADLKRIGIRELFGFHHSAESIGRRKPEPDMFRAALRSPRSLASEHELLTGAPSVLTWQVQQLRVLLQDTGLIARETGELLLSLQHISAPC